jgi:hypothetical protein
MTSLTVSDKFMVEFVIRQMEGSKVIPKNRLKYGKQLSVFYTYIAKVHGFSPRSRL